MSPEEAYDASLHADASQAAEAENVWDKAKSAVAKNRPIGTFQAEIAAATLGRSDSSDRLQIHYELVILAGPSKGIKLDKYDGLETEQQTNISQGQLARIGVNIKTLAFKLIPALLLTLAGKKVVIATKTKGAFYNIFFQKALDTLAPKAGGTSPATAGPGPKTAAPRKTKW